MALATVSGALVSVALVVVSAAGLDELVSAAEAICCPAGNNNGSHLAKALGSVVGSKRMGAGPMLGRYAVRADAEGGPANTRQNPVIKTAKGCHFNRPIQWNRMIFTLFSSKDHASQAKVLAVKHNPTFSSSVKAAGT